MARLSAILVALLLVSDWASAQDRTLRQLAVESQGKIGRTEGGSGWGRNPFPAMVARADLILEGTVVSRRTYPTPDDRDIYTDYQFVPKQIILQRIAVSSERPGVAPPVIFKTRGGTVVFDGYSFSLDVSSNGKRVQLQEGDHVVIFGIYDPKDGKWCFTPWDVFNLSGDIVQNDLPVFEPAVEGLMPRMSVQAFVEKIREVAVTRR